MGADEETIILIVTPIFGIVLLTFTLFLLPRLSGWERLESAFPDQPEQASLERIGFQTLFIKRGMSPGLGPRYHGPVVLEPCRGGLRIRIWKVLQPFSGPVFIPWQKIQARPVTSMGITACQLVVSSQDEFRLTIIARVARRIARVTGGALPLPPELA